MVLVDGHKPEDNVFVETSLKLANIYAKWGRYPEAEAGFTFCLNAQKAKLKTGGISMCMNCPEANFIRSG